MKSSPAETLALVRLCCRVLDDKKAGELSVLDVSSQSSITDFLILATATSEPHLRALRIELEKAFDAASVHLVGQETAPESGWLVIDAFDVMVHLFLPAKRELYSLERLWRDAKEVEVAGLLQPEPKAKPVRRTTRARTPAKKKAVRTKRPRS